MCSIVPRENTRLPKGTFFCKKSRVKVKVKEINFGEGVAIIFFGTNR